MSGAAWGVIAGATADGTGRWLEARIDFVASDESSLVACMPAELAIGGSERAAGGLDGDSAIKGGRLADVAGASVRSCLSRDSLIRIFAGRSASAPSFEEISRVASMSLRLITSERFVSTISAASWASG